MDERDYTDMNKDNGLIKIINTDIIEANYSKAMTKTQKIICRLFDITPERKRYYTVMIKTSPELQIGDVFIDDKGNRWYVIDKKANVCFARNLVPMYEFTLLGREICLYNTTYKE